MELHSLSVLFEQQHPSFFGRTRLYFAKRYKSCCWQEARDHFTPLASKKTRPSCLHTNTLALNLKAVTDSSLSPRFFPRNIIACVVLWCSGRKISDLAHFKNTQQRFIAGQLRPTQTCPNDSTSGRGDEREGVAMGEIKSNKKISERKLARVNK